MRHAIAAQARHRQIIDQAIVDDLAAEITIEANPGIEDRPRIFDAFTRANAALIQPKLEGLVQAYNQACSTTTTRAAARIFMQNLLEAEA